MNLRLDSINQWWFWLMAVVTFLPPFFYWRAGRRSGARLQALFGGTMAARLTVSLHRRHRILRRFLLSSAVFLTWLALSRPRGEDETAPGLAAHDNTVIAVDVSLSMLAEDAEPNRLRLAQWLAARVIAVRAGDRFALVPFAGDAFLEVPLTRDQNTLHGLLEAFSIDTIPIQGTDIGSALKLAGAVLAATDTGRGAVVLLSDGEELQGDARAEAGVLADRQIPVFAVAVGDPGATSLIPLADGSFLRDREGRVVTTRADRRLLEELAVITGGRYWQTAAPDEELVAELVQAMTNQSEAFFSEYYRHRRTEYYQYPLGAAVVLLMIGFLINERRAQPRIGHEYDAKN